MVGSDELGGSTSVCALRIASLTVTTGAKVTGRLLGATRGGRHGPSEQHIRERNALKASLGLDHRRGLVELSKYAQRVARASVRQSVAHDNTRAEFEHSQANHQLLDR